MNVHTLAEEEEKEQKVVNLKLITGGKDGGISDGDDFLENMEEGTIFLVQEKAPARPFHLDQFQLVQKTEKSYFLVSSLNGVVKLFLPRPAHRFCGKYQLWEVLGIRKVEEETADE